MDRKFVIPYQITPHEYINPDGNKVEYPYYVIIKMAVQINQQYRFHGLSNNDGTRSQLVDSNGNVLHYAIQHDDTYTVLVPNDLYCFVELSCFAEEGLPWFEIVK